MKQFIRDFMLQIRKLIIFEDSSKYTRPLANEAELCISCLDNGGNRNYVLILRCSNHLFATWSSEHAKFRLAGMPTVVSKGLTR